jgi:3-dehydroquinate dehydratase-2
MAQRRGQVLPLRPRGKRSSPLRFLIVSGPNLQLLGSREPGIYGSATLGEIHARLSALAERHGVLIDARQSNYEGELVTWIGEARSAGFHGVVVNPGGLTHTSVSLLDAVLASQLPVVEVHLSNPDARESFRRESFIARGCLGRVAGFGPMSYELGFLGLLAHHESPEPTRRDAAVRPLPKTRLAQKK